jgi:hypothetical protein
LLHVKEMQSLSRLGRVSERFALCESQRSWR